MKLPVFVFVTCGHRTYLFYVVLFDFGFVVGLRHLLKISGTFGFFFVAKLFTTVGSTVSV